MWQIISDYSFISVAIGTVLLAVASGLIGTISVLTKQSLIGDTIGHATYPGVICAFMLFHTRHPFVLMIGAMVFGYLSAGLVYLVTSYSQHSTVNVMALISSSFFGLGMVLKQYIQANPRFGDVSQSGLQHYLFGQAAFIQMEDILLIAGVSFVCICFVGIVIQPLKLYLFSPAYAQILGVPTKWLNHIIRLCMIALIAVGLKVVGVVLISSFLIAPSVLGLVYSRNYRQMIVIAMVSASVSAFLGTLASSVVSGLSTGPAIIVVMSICVFIAIAGEWKKTRSKNEYTTKYREEIEHE